MIASIFSAKVICKYHANLGADSHILLDSIFLIEYFKFFCFFFLLFFFFQPKNNFKLKLPDSVTSSDSNVLTTLAVLRRSFHPCRVGHEAEHKNCQLLIPRIIVCA